MTETAALLRLRATVTDEPLWDGVKQRFLAQIEQMFTTYYVAGLEAGLVAARHAGHPGFKSAADDVQKLLTDPEAARKLAMKVAAEAEAWWQQISATSRKRLFKVITDAEAAGTAMPQIIAQVREIFGAARAATIAVSETTRLFGAGQQAAYDAMGVEEWDWQTSEDGLVCQICQDNSANGPYPMSVAFSPGHPGCRCWPRPFIGGNSSIVSTAAAKGWASGWNYREIRDAYEIQQLAPGDNLPAELAHVAGQGQAMVDAMTPITAPLYRGMQLDSSTYREEFQVGNTIQLSLASTSGQIAVALAFAYGKFHNPDGPTAFQSPQSVIIELRGSKTGLAMPPEFMPHGYQHPNDEVVVSGAYRVVSRETLRNEGTWDGSVGTYVHPAGTVIQGTHLGHDSATAYVVIEQVGLYDAAAAAQPSQKAMTMLPAGWDERMVTVTSPDSAEVAEKDANHKGAMVALYPSPQDAAALCMLGGEPPEELHVTLAFLAKDARELGGVRDRLLLTIGALAMRSAPLAGEISGIGRFSIPDGDAFYASVDLPCLQDFRSTLVDELRFAGAPPSEDHGFTPHMTLAYLEADEPTPPPIRTRPVVFTAVSVVLGGQRTDFPFGGK